MNICLSSSFFVCFENCSVMSNCLWPHGYTVSRPEYRVSSCSLLQEIFPTQGSKSGFPLCRWILYQLSHQGSQFFVVVEATKSRPNLLQRFTGRSIKKDEIDFRNGCSGFYVLIRKQLWRKVLLWGLTGKYCYFHWRKRFTIKWALQRKRYLLCENVLK